MTDDTLRWPRWIIVDDELLVFADESREASGQLIYENNWSFASLDRGLACALAVDDATAERILWPNGRPELEAAL